MTALWIAVGVLCAVAAVALLTAVRRAGRDEPSARGDYDLAVYRDQLAEIERDRARGLLGEREAEAAALEIQRRMLGADARRDTARTKTRRFGRRWDVVLVVAILVPLGALATYLSLGAPTVPDAPFAARQQSAERAPQDMVQDMAQDMDTLLERLAARLEKRPDDIRGWRLLARSSMATGRYAQAVAAYRRVIALGDNDPELAVDYAEALTAAAGATVTEEAHKIFGDVVARHPANAKAQYYLGLARAQQGDLRGALQAWIDLRAIGAPDAPWHKLVEQQIARAAETSGIDPAAIDPSPEVRDLTDRPRGPTAEDVEAAQRMTPEERAAFIRSMVERLAARLEENPDDRRGWLRLARAYEVLGEKEKAREARAKAEALENRAAPENR